VVPSQFHRLFSGDDADRFLKLASFAVAGEQHIGLSEARGLVLFRVVSRGYRGYTEAKCPVALVRLQAIRILTLEPECLKNRWTTTGKSRRWKGALTRGTQAACDFSFSASKSSPFFHRVSAVAAILRASVRRTMVGLMPLASERW